MNASSKTRLHAAWDRLTGLDIFALVIVLVYAGLWILGQFFPRVPHRGIFLFTALLAAGYIVVRGLLWVRNDLLWSLRNRLIVAYVFIAVVPILLLLSMAGLTAYVLYWQLGSYVLHTELQERVTRVSDVAATMATSYAIDVAAGHHADSSDASDSNVPIRRSTMAALPGLKIELDKGEELLHSADGSMNNRFAGIVMDGDTLTLLAAATRPTPTGQVFVTASVPVTPDLLDTIAPELRPIVLDVRRPVSQGTAGRGRRIVFFNGQRFEQVEQVGTHQRESPAGVNVFDKLITGIAIVDVVNPNGAIPNGAVPRVFASFTTRPSLLNERLFSPLGNLRAIITALLVIGGIFLVIEFGSLATGIVLTRTITTSVNGLYRATQHIQAGDLTFRVPVTQKDQLGALSESFNSMMQSVSTLIEEQRQRQMLENELSIAHQVQEQLFPHTVPKVAGLELEAICRPARVVSGDYYDFIRLSPTRVAIALADISGKGISAALLMANVQAALRSEVLRHRDSVHGQGHAEIHTDQIIAHLNRHLFRNTSDERYATCFFAVYDSETRHLTYTNAGHLPPLYISERGVQKLETGGMVVGLFNDVHFEQGEVEIEPGGLLIAYSDGLVEPENARGEEFGGDRLLDVVLRHRDASPHEIADAIVHAAQQWSSSPEQADDMTIIVARMVPVAVPV